MLLILIIIAFIVLFIFFAKYQKKQAQAEALAAGEPNALLHHGIALINKDQVEAGLDFIHQAVDKGLAVAAITLAELYSGRFPQIPADPKASNDWYKKAAELDAQYLSLLTLSNLLSPEAQTREELEMLEAQLKPNAEAGDATFQYELGLLYERQPLLDPDATQAINWFEKAAAQQHPDADYHLGALYWHDGRVTSDYSKAREYFEKSAAAGDELAKDDLGHMLAAGQGGPKDLARAEALLSERAADDDFRQYYLGKRFLYGEDFAVDYDKARHWLSQSVARGNDFAKIEFAHLLLKAPQNESDYQQAKIDFEEFALKWNEDALLGLGKIYEQGLGVSRQPIKALMYYQLAAMSNRADHLKELARFSQQLGTLEIREAERLRDSFLHQYPIPAEQQQYFYAYKAESFLSGEKPTQEALQAAETWFIKSAELGNEIAMRELVNIYSAERLNKPVQVFIWSSLLLRHFGKYGMNSAQLLYQTSAKSCLTESELAYAETQIEAIETQFTPYLESER
ncbi:MAG: sel1 repeat family protein [Gammaproteobacteria bacterium]|nr:sel1 repeat family protein [Gammaproteobacteria bacterium]MBU1476223.1 sel1 repeat family protein [Gammaproteobacteria bacterium]MBU2000692.1 sel1 repeat family protein [Gammaproteobacteria bacterium]MBU2131339.1 sel1 repeat family protein [Gammaproteobacteria bacterium]MBU2188897.1 sel1 repeat family protein [Gammaproteobacteria bacterium]